MKGTTEGSGIVQLEGGHIIRSTGRKDRHSKVYTTKGPRDRRVRLSAQTAIQFYDVQDRLGYDRPSKAVDWLINKAKPAIDKLNEFASAVDSNPSSNGLVSDHQSEAQSEFGLTRPNHNPGCCKSSFMASPGDQPDANFINTMKPFFATTNFPGFSSDDISVSRESFPARDLGISLHSVPGSFQRIDGWNNGGDMDNRVEFLMSSMENSQQAAAFSHRDLLQSNLAVSPWNQRPLARENQHNHQTYSSKTSDFGSPFGMGFHVPARIYGDGEVDNHR